MYGTISGLSVFGAFLLDFFKRENSYSRWLVMFARVLVILVSCRMCNPTCLLQGSLFRWAAVT